MMEGERSNTKRAAVFKDRRDFLDVVLSWSLEQIYDENLYKNQVENIPEEFESVEQYFGSYVYPLLEETRAQLHSSMEIISNAPFAEVIAFDESKPYGKNLYNVKIDSWRNRFSYKTLPGDIFVLADAKAEDVSDLQRTGRQWAFVTVTKIPEDEEEDDDNNSTSTSLQVKASKDIGNQRSLFLIFLINRSTNKRIWNALHMFGNLEIIKNVLNANSLIEEDGDLCCVQRGGSWDEKFRTSVTSELNESQINVVLACLHKIHCNHKSAVKLIWGPPGTGKTKTISTLLFTLLRMGCKTLTCAPTNAAITGVASRTLKLVRESFETDIGIDSLFFPLGDILLFGNKERLQLDSDIEEIHLDYRVKKLTDCLSPLTGWRHCFASMIDLLEDCVSQYNIFLENESLKEREHDNDNEINSFLDFLRKRFVSTSSAIKNCILVFCTHLPKKYVLEQNFQNMVSLIGLLQSFETLLFQDNVESQVVEELFSCSEIAADISESFMDMPFLLYGRRRECLSALRSVLRSLNGSFNVLDRLSIMSKQSIEEYCLQTASLLFCTASSSYKLHSMEMKPLSILVIDEAAQLKECESTIPLQLPGLRHAILFGDECQLPAMIESNISGEAGFGRSLFERLSSLGYSKHLLNIQYRMHPSISFFPNSKFYHKQIKDSPNVKRKSHEKHYLSWPMFGPYSFINIVGGREEKDDVGRSWRNMVEVAVVMKVLQKLYKAWVGSEQKLSVGVISPYAAQVAAIQEKLGWKYDNVDGFAVKVKSVDGFQGGEEDIILISTVRSNRRASIGFISNLQRTNVALTRARHCLWILGNERTLCNSQSVWEALVLDAKNRQCFFNADQDKDLNKAILDVKKEFEQFDDLLKGDSILFRTARWKVLFSDNFLKSFQKLKYAQTKKLVINLLLKLSSGWRPKKKRVDPIGGDSSQILKQFKVEGLYVACANDIVKDWSDVVKEFRYHQVLKIWDVLRVEDIPKLIKRLDSMFGKYTADFINHCKERCLEGNLEVPKSWSSSFDIVMIKNLDSSENVIDLSGSASDGRSYVENVKVSESLMLMKFYALSPGVVGHLLFNHDGNKLDLPFEVTDQELEIILFPRSTFILGRSGTGKTTIITRKLFQKEKLHHMAKEIFYGVKSDRPVNSQEMEAEETISEKERTILRQLFVTVSHKLCYAVKQHVSHLKSSACGGNFSEGSSSIDIDDFDDATQFKNVPDTFVDVPPEAYPLVITFHDFLIMLDGTVGNSYFERFHEVRKHSLGKVRGGSVAVQTFIRKKEVNYERFSSSYWPHFNTQLTKMLDSSRVFTEIISHIKGGPKALEAGDGKLSGEDYVLLSEGRVSNLNRYEREIIYEVFRKYEKMKVKNGDFDMADLVIDLHRRLRVESYEGDEIHFVYVDEVQDLTLSQIALFKYICKNVEEGFVFSGDTAQTIARGIDFRFQDIRSLFYKKFLLESKSCGHDKRKEKGIVSDIFHLSQNFRTHDGVLKLSQSVIELLYRFFPQSIDVLLPETSLIYGEAPILLGSGNNQNTISTIFGNSGKAGRSFVGFGAEQVILVRDDHVRKEITKYVGKEALVLTIVECKGLEFQDVLLYNFFGSSPLKNQWRLIYKYMEEQDLANSTSLSCPSFNDAKHHVLCSELKQLYVAVTRTRQRLWICENVEEFCRPMFDYWMKKCLVQVRQLDDSLAQEMQVASSPEEWRLRGIKLYREYNYEMATMCFQRAEDTYWERRSKASGLRATADHIRHSDPKAANTILWEAAEIFEVIGKADSAAQCFSDLGEYERAGRLYLEKCGERELKRAGECFSLGGCYELAAEVYARGYFFSNCLEVCTKGKLFDLGFQYIQNWRQHGTTVRMGKQIDRIEQEFLQTCALHYYKLKDSRSMMKFVTAFQSINLIRKFLKSHVWHDELPNAILWEAAETFELIGKADFAAQCFYDLGEYERAGRLYLKKCGEPELKRAGECFSLAGCYELAADVYARGYFFSDCLEVCTKGKLFDLGFQYIQNWRQHGTTDFGVVRMGKEKEKIEQEFLQTCALHYYKLKDSRSMIKFVTAFQSIDLMRMFLKSHGCLDELPNEILWEAAETFEVIGKADSAAQCFYDLGEYERAGRLYLEKCGESELKRAGECFSLAGCYELAADVYSRGHCFSDCLKVCTKGKLFDLGFQYIQNWKQRGTTDFGVVRIGKENGKIEQEFLETCALHYYKLKDTKSMMKFVTAFQSIDLKRKFLKSHVCLDELPNAILSEAAEIFEVVGMADSAAQCFFDLGEYERAGRLYLEKCGESELKRAGECFSLAGCYELAADVYSRGHCFSDCLKVCTKGKLFDLGFQYIQNWKQHGTTDFGVVRIGKAEQEFLETCALHYYKLKDTKSMMKFVTAFQSIDLMRKFLKSHVCLDELPKAILWEAAEIFEVIGMADSAAQCLFDLGEYERAGRLYLEKCGESELKRAGECFSLAGCYELAADVYSRGHCFSDCLKVCTKGKLFDLGFQYIQNWKQRGTTDFGVVRIGKENGKIEQEFLETCALHYYKLKDTKSMMKFVTAFQSIDLKRKFLKSHVCLDELPNAILSEAAEIFEVVGMADSAAQCFFDLGEYERAGRLYFEKCGESELKRAGECFSLAGCYELAADVYARGYFFSDCLEVCTKGKLFDLGFEYIQNWKQHGTTDFCVVSLGKEIDKIEQEFLETCVLHYYKLKDSRSMMKFLTAFQSIDLMRKFLKSHGCLDELLMLEEESGNFMVAADMARLRGDIIRDKKLVYKLVIFLSLPFFLSFISKRQR